MNSAAVNIHVQGFMWTHVSNSLGCVKDLGFLGYMVTPGININYTKWNYSSCTILHCHTSNMGGLHLLQSLPTFAIFWLNDSSQLMTSDIIVFIWFSWWLKMLSTYSCAYGHLYIITTKFLFKFFVHFLTGLFVFYFWTAFSYILYIRFIRHMVWKYFPHSVRCFPCECPNNTN